MRIRVFALSTALVVVTLILSSTIVFASTVYFVSKSGNDIYTGSSWATAKLMVRAAIGAASAGDQVWVAKGTYSEVTMSQNFTLKPGVALYGGFAGTETSLSQRKSFPRQTPDSYETILDGGQYSNSVVTIPAGAASSTLIDGFTVTRGLGALSHERVGGGIYCGSGSPTITNNTATANQATMGAGIYIEGGSPLISGNSIIANQSWEFVDYGMPSSVYGGGIYCAAGSPIITNNYIEGNSAVASTWSIFGPKPSASACGGGLYLLGSAVVSGNVISSNTVNASGGTLTMQGGGIWSVGSSLINNTISDNVAQVGGMKFPVAGDGGGIYCGQGYLENNIVAFNTGGGIRSAGQMILRNNDVYGNTVYQYSGASSGVGDISADPLFRSRANVDYHLTALSPCVNGGYNAAPGMSSTDIDGEDRVAGGTVDIGADELWWRVADDRTSLDGLAVEHKAAIVTAVFGSVFYIESDDRSSGIRVECAGHLLQPGMRADVAGLLATNNDGEKYIAATRAVHASAPNDSGSVDPVVLPLKFVGGSSFAYLPGPPKYGQCGVKDCSGLNNIGLLVTVTGTVVDRDTANPSTWFKITDGSGVNVKVIPPSGTPVPSLNSYVSVTGISSCEKPDTDVLPLVRAVGMTVLRNP